MQFLYKLLKDDGCLYPILGGLKCQAKWFISGWSQNCQVAFFTTSTKVSGNLLTMAVHLTALTKMASLFAVNINIMLMYFIKN